MNTKLALALLVSIVVAAVQVLCDDTMHPVAARLAPRQDAPPPPEGDMLNVADMVVSDRAQKKEPPNSDTFHANCYDMTDYFPFSDIYRVILLYDMTSWAFGDEAGKKIHGELVSHGTHFGCGGFSYN